MNRLNLKKITIKEASSQDSDRWNRFVEKNPDSGPYHLWGWSRAITEAYKHKIYHLIAEDNESKTIAGILPLLYIKIPFIKRELVSMPFCDYGGPLADTQESAEALCRKSIEVADSLKARLEIRCSRPLSDPTDFALYSGKVRLLLELPMDSLTLFKNFKSKLRSQIKKPLKEGLFAKKGRGELLHDFYSVFCVNMRDLGSPVHSFIWFRKLLSNLKEKVRIGVVYKEKIPVAGGIILLHNKTVSIPWASSLREYSRLSPNMLLYWSFLEFASDNGYRFFDFGRSNPGSGTFKFKRQWGAEPMTLCWYNPVVSGTDHAGLHNIRAKAENFWSCLPLSVSNCMGPKLRKYISL